MAKVKKIIISGCVLVFSAFLSSAVMFSVVPNNDTLEVFNYNYQDEPTIVIIDPGHGGEDGGAVSVLGFTESTINLSVALKLDSILKLYGVNTEMTRTEDISIHSDDAQTLAEKKRSDLKNRVSFINSFDNCVLVSIHQNNFQSSKYFGAQTFYSQGDILSEELAVNMQQTLRAVLDPGNTRQAAAISDSIYLMKNITCPAVLVECGFLSNKEEAAKLNSDNYQIKIAASLTSSLLSWEQF